MKKIVKVTALLSMLIITVSALASCVKREPPTPREFTGSDYSIPELDLCNKPDNIDEKYNYLYEMSVVDNKAKYLAHPDSVLLKNGDILTLYPKGHGRGQILSKISHDNGKTWVDGIENAPKSWKDSLETPTVYRCTFTDGKTKDKLIVISANPQWHDIKKKTVGGFNCSVSDDEGKSWTEFERFYDVNCENTVIPIVAMSSLTQLKENGKFVDKWLGLFHDRDFYNYKTILTFDESGNPQWSVPEKYFSAYRDIEEKSNMCEVEVIRSEQGKGDELCLLTRSNTKQMNSLVSFSSDEGVTWSEPRELPAALNGERHKADYTKDGRLFITFRSIERGQKAKELADESVTSGWISEGWVAWVGTYDDIKNGTEGQYRIRLGQCFTADKTDVLYSPSADTGYCGNVVLDDGTIMTSSYGRFDSTDKVTFGTDLRTYIASRQIRLEDIDSLIEQLS